MMHRTDEGWQARRSRRARVLGLVALWACLGAAAAAQSLHGRPPLAPAQPPHGTLQLAPVRPLHRAPRAPAPAQRGTPPLHASPQVSVPDLESREVFPFHVPGARGYVLIFVRPGCPVSNRAAPEVARLHAEFASRDIAMWLVYPGMQPRDEIRRHLEEFAYPLRPLRDPGMRLVDLAGVRVTPEAAVFDASRQLVYRGRLDDRYLDIGRARREPTTRDVHDVLSALLAGRPLPYASQPAVGCFIDDLR